ncbi:MAG: RHS repeat-associated core domain-containing protein [Chloroflexota bacterium]|nr:RHS repeat-associated core domain-containing protein [Chloroflexota bacterium]
MGEDGSSISVVHRLVSDWSGSVNSLSLESASYGKPCASRRTRSIRDGDGALLKREQIASGVAETSTVYIGGVYEAHSDGSVTKYYQAYGRAVAVRQVPATGGPGTLSFLLADQLGTTTMVLDATGAVVADQRYWPYGAARSSTSITQTDKLYTGQRQEPGDPAALGLYDYHARFYSTLVGRFVSADSRGSNGTDIYGYVTDNPLRYTDPSGNCCTFPGRPAFS